MAKLTKQQKEDLIQDALELNEKGKSKYTQQQLADKYKISKGMINRYVKEKVNKSKQLIPDEIECRVNLKKIENEKSKHFSKHEQEKVNNYIDNTVRNILYIDKCINENQELADTLQQQLKNNIDMEIEKLKEGTHLNPSEIFNALTLVDGFSKVSTRNRMALLPKEFNPTPKDDEGKDKIKKVTIARRSDRG